MSDESYWDDVENWPDMYDVLSDEEIAAMNERDRAEQAYIDDVEAEEEWRSIIKALRDPSIPFIGMDDRSRAVLLASHEEYISNELLSQVFGGDE